MCLEVQPQLLYALITWLIVSRHAGLVSQAVGKGIYCGVRMICRWEAPCPRAEAGGDGLLLAPSNRRDSKGAHAFLMESGGQDDTRQAGLPGG